jgi:hypothetical protein
MLASLSLAMFVVCAMALAARRSIAVATAGLYEGGADKAVGARSDSS